MIISSCKMVATARKADYIALTVVTNQAPQKCDALVYTSDFLVISNQITEPATRDLLGPRRRVGQDHVRAIFAQSALLVFSFTRFG